MAGPSLAELMAQAGISTQVLAGAAALSGQVREIGLLAADPPQPGALLVASWTAARKDGPLPSLEPLVRRAVSLGATGLVVVTGDRRVDPAQDVTPLAETVALPVVWVDEQLTVARVVDVLAQARSDLALAAGNQRLTLLEALATILDAGVDKDSALRAARLLPVVGVRILMLPTRPGSVLVDWTHEATDDDPELSVLVQLDIGANLVGDTPPSGALELTCTRSLTTDELAYAGQLSSLLGLWMMSRHRATGPADHLQNDLQGELLTAILGTDLAARETAIRRRRRLGVFPPHRSIVLVVEPFGHRLTATGLCTLSRHVINAVRLRDGNASVIVREGGLLMIVGEDVDLSLLVTEILRRVGLPICIGVSTTVASIDRLPGGYRQAQRSTMLAQQLGRVNTMTRYHDLGYYRLLVLLPEHERNRFVSEILGPLAGDGPEQADLRRTIRVVGENRGNIRAAADRLFIHPNTLRQRIGKLSQVLGPFLEDADTYLNVYIALALHRLRDRE